MRLLICAVAVTALVSTTAIVTSPTASAAPASRGALTPQIEAVLKTIKDADKGLLAVSEEDGRFLRVLVAARGARSILEIGGASGYSAIWLGLGARETGGHVVSIEYDPQRAKEEAENIHKAGLEDVVHAIHGDAFKEIPKLSGSFDFVFLDAWKPDYIKFFNMVFPRMTPGGIFTAHNVINKATQMEPFLKEIETNPGVFTSIVSPGSEGMSVSYKLR